MMPSMTLRFVEIYGGEAPPPPPPDPKTPPTVPLNVRGTDEVVGQDVLFQWDSPASYGSAPLLGFKVTVNGSQTDIKDGLAREFRVYNVTPDTDYVFTVLAYNKWGNSPVSAPITVHTDPLEPPPSPTLNEVLSDQEPVSLLFTKVDADPIVTQYRGEVIPESTGVKVTQVVAANKPAAIQFSGLPRGTMATFQVFAINANGERGSNMVNEFIVPLTVNEQITDSVTQVTEKKSRIKSLFKRKKESK